MVTMLFHFTSVSEGSSLCQTRRTTEGKGWSLPFLSSTTTARRDPQTPAGYALRLQSAHPQDFPSPSDSWPAQGQAGVSPNSGQSTNTPDLQTELPRRSTACGSERQGSWQLRRLRAG